MPYRLSISGLKNVGSGEQGTVHRSYRSPPLPLELIVSQPPPTLQTTTMRTTTATRTTTTTMKTTTATILNAINSTVINAMLDSEQTRKQGQHL